MVHRLTRRAPYLLALLMGALVLAWRPITAQPAPAGQETAHLRVAVAVLGSVPGAWSPSHVSDWTPVGHRSPSWHRGTGRRPSRSPVVSPIAAPAGSIPATDPFIRQQVVSFARFPRRIEHTGRSAAPPRAPPAIN